MRFLVRFRRQYRVFNLNGFSMIIIKYRVKLSFTLLANMTPSLVKLIPESQHAYLDAERWACNTIKERRNLLWAFINISPLKWASQLYDPLFEVQSSGILTRFPFAHFTVLPLCLGPTNSYMSATRKKTFPTTIFKASPTIMSAEFVLISRFVFRLNNCYYYRDLH
jgi:hypothetical protein